MTLRPLLLAPLLSSVLAVGHAAASDALVGPRFAPESVIELPRDAVPAPPASRGRAARAVAAPSRGDTRANLTPPARTSATEAAPIMTDTYVQDGTGPVVAANPGQPTNFVVAFNEGWDFDPDIPMVSNPPGNYTWSPVVFPSGSGIYGGYPHTPWSGAGNDPNEFFVSLAREDLYPTDNTHTVLARSTDAGHTFSSFYEVPGNVRQDRPMFDVDRADARGGQTGPYDGKLYLCYDNWGSGGSGYAGSYLDVLAADGTLQSEVPVSAPALFRGSQFQPVAGILDGQLYLVSTSLTNGGATVNATFHEFAGAGAVSKSFSKSTLSWAPAGQKLGTSTHWGVNGHRIDEHGFLDVDRSSGPHRGYLYFLTNRNPHPGDPSADQGDLYLSLSYTRGTSWQTAPIPTAANHTQYFPMMDVDDQGWIHVVYYENEEGYPDDGVLTASRAELRYTVSRDGGVSWTPPVQVNEPANDLNMEDPPLELGAFDYNLLGDYMQLHAVGTGENTMACVGWTGYDQYRSDDGVGTKKQRVYVTLVASTPAPAAAPGPLAALAAGLVAAGALALRARRRTPAS